MRTLAAVFVIGCQAGPLPPLVENHPDDAAPSVELAAAADHEVRIFRTSGRGLELVRTVHTPAQVEGLAWAGRDPVALLIDYDENSKAGPHHGELGAITANGYEPLPALPPALFP